MSNDTFVPVYEADNQAEANIIENILKQNGVDCTTKSVGPSLQIMVEHAQCESAEQIIMNYESPDDLD
ncbi:MAG: DUF2007 domain-containing protein [Chloroflexota bacterium]